MPESRSLGLDSFDLEIERTLKALRMQKGTSSTTMANQHLEENKVLKDYAASSIDGDATSIRRPIIMAFHFEIKPAIIQII